jgi:putative SOS response-associated peptidase YedK
MACCWAGRSKSCAMIVTDANQFVGELHDRMPVILEPDQFEAWLTQHYFRENPVMPVDLAPHAIAYLYCSETSHRSADSRLNPS